MWRIPEACGNPYAGDHLSSLRANGSGPKSGHPIALARWGPGAGQMTSSAKQLLRCFVASLLAMTEDGLTRPIRAATFVST